MKKITIIILTFTLSLICFHCISLLIYITPTIETIGQGVALGVLWAFILCLLGTTSWLILCLIKQTFKNKIMINKNKLIAEFMGLKEHKGSYYFINKEEWIPDVELEYHKSWDWLMPVVQKIEQYCEGVPQEMLNISLYSDINEVHNAVVEFINEHNKTI